AIAPAHVRLDSGETVPASGVIDARGPGDVSALELGWQKFVGREYRFAQPHGLERPIVMDATVGQAEGYRFVSCLPFSETRLLVAATSYRPSLAVDVPALQERIAAYVTARGWQPAEVDREEAGVPPVAMGGDAAALWNQQPG